MRFLVLSDLHGNTGALDLLDKQFSEADAVLFAGDFARFGAPETGLPALEALCKKHDVIYAVLGNCDEPEFITELESRDISVQKGLVSADGLAFAGSGGGSRFTGTTPYERSDEELVADFSIITEQGEAAWDNLIALMHNPPAGTACDCIESGAHVGSPLLRQFIETYRPLAVICGHIHESAAIDTVGGTTVINPGALLEGRYAWLTVEQSGGTWQVTGATLERLS